MKKSFTLVEISIVLLILSLLLGTVLVGRKIVDRAKMQRVIFEIDYYKKSLYLFTDMFDVLPGNLDEQTCMKYAEFSQIKDATFTTTIDDETGKYCKTDRSTDSYARMTDGYVNSQIIATSDRWSSFLETMREMKTAKVINEVATTINEQETQTGITASLAQQGPNDVACRDCITHANIKRTQGIASFDDTGAITIAGISLDSSKSDSYRLNFIRGSNDYNGSGQHELRDVAFQKTIMNHNAIFIYRNTPANLDNAQGNGSQSTGILSADIANKLDVKLDDGRPGTGLVLAFKNGYVKTDNLTDTDKKRICYNQLQNSVSSAYYTAENDVAFGCNIAVIVK